MARVTGEGVSRIDGVLSVDGAQTDFFLLNPNGVIFGNGAEVNVQGAFNVSTADYLTVPVGDQIEAYFADPANEGRLEGKMLSPFLLGFFEGRTPGVISFDGGEGAGNVRFSALAGTKIVGRDVVGRDAELVLDRGGNLGMWAVGDGAVQLTPEGELNASARGTIDLSKTIVNLTPGGSGTHSFEAGKIKLSAGSQIRRRATSARAVEFGDLNFKAGEIQLTQGSEINYSVDDEARGGKINLETGLLMISGSESEISGGTLPGSRGRTASIRVSATGHVILSDGGQLSVLSDSAATSRASDGAAVVKVEAGDLTLAGAGSGILVGSSASANRLSNYGEAGELEVAVDGRLEISDGAVIQTNTDTDASVGDLTVRAENLVITGVEKGEAFTGILSFTTLRGEGSQGGPGGNISVEVRENIEITRGGLIDASSFGAGDAGSVTVRTGSLAIDRAESPLFTGIGTDSDAHEERRSIFRAPGQAELSLQRVGVRGGDAGSVAVAVREDLTLSNGGTISSSSEGSGNGGSVEVSAQTIDIRGKGELTRVVPTASSAIVALTEAGAGSEGDGGTVRVSAEKITLSEEGLISAEALNEEGLAGSVELTAGEITLTGEAVLKVLSAGRDAGTLEIKLTGDLTVEDSQISADAGGDGGDILVEGGRLLRVERSEIRAEALGNGGNIFVTGGRFFIARNSRLTGNAVSGSGGEIDIQSLAYLASDTAVTVSSQFGAPGEIRINPEVSLSDSDPELESEPLDATEQLQAECTKQLPTEAGSFIRAGKGGTPRMPGGYLPSMRLLD